jgi:hypothetical protein
MRSASRCGSGGDTTHGKCLLHNHWTKFYELGVVPEARSDAKKYGGGIGQIGTELGECVQDRAVVVVVILHMVSVYLLLIISNPSPPSTPYTPYPFCPPLSPSMISCLCPSLVSHSGFGNDMTQRAWARHGHVLDRMAGLLSLRGVRVGWGGRGE